MVEVDLRDADVIKVCTTGGTRTFTGGEITIESSILDEGGNPTIQILGSSVKFNRRSRIRWIINCDGG